jgi:hypothetical protein
MPHLDTLRPRVRVGRGTPPRTRAHLSRALFVCLLLLRRWRGAFQRVSWDISSEELRIRGALFGFAALVATATVVVAGAIAGVLVGAFCLFGLWLFPRPALRQLERLREGETMEAPVYWRDQLARQWQLAAWRLRSWRSSHSGLRGH